MSIEMVQGLVVEVDSLKLLEQYLRIAIPTVLASQEELAVKVVDRECGDTTLRLPVFLNEAKHFPVILIGGWYSPKESGEKSQFAGYEPLSIFRPQGNTNSAKPAIRYVNKLLKKNHFAWSRQFVRKFGDGYGEGFNHFDGSVEVGYELRACRSFPEWLAICLVHIYYGK